jgi:serine phosphatase RsbU (regulator of sigma subunit)
VAGRTIAIGAASRPYPGERANGDAWATHHPDGALRISVIDGLGHGPDAATAAQAAIAALTTEPTLLPDGAIELCHRALRGTRGAAISVAWVDVAQSRLVYAGIGNIEAVLAQDGQQQRPIAYRGIVGATMRTIRPFELPLLDDWVLVIHTDGIRARFDIGKVDGYGRRDPQMMADGLLAEWGRATDDATVVVACSA